jgi:hypothetical protein
MGVTIAQRAVVVEGGLCAAVVVAAPRSNNTEVDDSRAAARRITDKQNGGNVRSILQLQHEADGGEIHLIQTDRVDATDVADGAERCPDPALVPMLERETGGHDVRKGGSPREAVAPVLGPLQLDQVFGVVGEAI